MHITVHRIKHKTESLVFQPVITNVGRRIVLNKRVQTTILIGAVYRPPLVIKVPTEWLYQHSKRSLVGVVEEAVLLE